MSTEMTKGMCDGALPHAPIPQMHLGEQVV